jgi:EmrB/QacA subfamily drug resistance transporter
MPEADAPPQATFTHREVLRILSGVLLCMLMAALDQTVLATALPAIAADFNGVPHLSWVITAYLLTSTATTLIFGKLSDFYGRRALLEISIGTFLLASLICALSQSMSQLIAARALQGIGGGGLYSMAQASIADVVSPRERGRYQAYITSMFGAASIAGPLIGGLSVDYLTWRWAFWINLPIGVVAFFLCHRGLARVAARRERRPIDYLGAALMLPGVTALMLVAAWGGVEFSWTSAPILALALGGAGFVIAFAQRERRAPEALLPPRLFASAVFRIASLLNFLINSVTVGTFLLIPVYLQFVLGVSAGISGAMLLPPLGAQIVSSIWTGQRVRRTGRYVPQPRCGFAILAIAALLFATMNAATSLVFCEIYLMIYCVGIGLCQAPLWVAAQNAAEPRDLGAATGATAFFRALGGAFGAAILWSSLLFVLDRTVASEGNAHFGSELLRGGRAALIALPPDTRQILMPALVRGFAGAFLVAATIAATAFVATYLLKEIPLRTTPGQAPKAQANAD